MNKYTVLNTLFELSKESDDLKRGIKILEAIEWIQGKDERESKYEFIDREINENWDDHVRGRIVSVIENANSNFINDFPNSSSITWLTDKLSEATQEGVLEIFGIRKR
ncbi:hypothetical protein QP168_09350 [Aerococcus urinae]|uniref:Uncharacterized protein n=1 Tax=Aerococcus mictus TaxID=2976810 RepID=A0A1E9PGV9_9LACT|nr:MULTISPECIES: hypothetical protein [Aerococcus]KAA9291218.1 hypothetical protein F6I06_06110 [Aerococcus mictus]MBU5611218.1 hypothetical protein [Aerococcus urinae]MCY3064953.1 hypothetical protein [Aerococcus mictus]MCY3077324.1 hypothetical protein [Aerococcus mictus]MCY3081423.1 hypothetical protein [Aerococcus mictus]